MNIQSFAKQLFARGQELGFGDMEIYYGANKATTVSVLKGEIKNYVIAQQGGVSFRGKYGIAMGYSYTEKIDEQSVEFLLTTARDNAGIMEMTEQEELYEGAAEYAVLERFFPAVAELEPAALIDAALTMEAAALAADSRVQQAIQCSTVKTEGEILIANTKGLHCHSSYTSVSAGLYLKAADGSNNATAGEYEFSLQDFKQVDIGRIARQAAAEAVAKLGAQPVATGSYPIIFRYDAATALLRIFVENLSAETVQKGFSRLQGKLGQRIAADNITLVDEPHQPLVPGAAAFDAEGYPTRPLVMVDKGSLVSFLHNCKTARLDGTVSTGHASKHSYSDVVTVGPHNTYLQPGDQSLDEMIAATPCGLLIVELQGLHSGVNAVSGNFSLAALGFLIEEGNIVRAVNQITVAGNLYEMLYNIDCIGNDLQIKDKVSAPSIRVTSLNIAGM